MGKKRKSFSHVLPHGLQPTKLLCTWDFPAWVLECVAISFFRGSSGARDLRQVSHISGRFFTIWDTGEAMEEVLTSIEFASFPAEPSHEGFLFLILSCFSPAYSWFILFIYLGLCWLTPSSTQIPQDLSHIVNFFFFPKAPAVSSTHTRYFPRYLPPQPLLGHCCAPS